MNEKSRFILSICAICGFFTSWALLSVNLQKISDNAAIRLWAFAPSTVELDEKFEITVQAWDKWEQLAIQYDQEIALEDYIVANESNGILVKNTDENSYSFPDDLVFKPSLVARSYFSSESYILAKNDGGYLKINNIKLSKPGIHYIKVISSDGLYTFSNPILVANNLDYHLYWGDIHGHTDLSDGTGTPEFAYYYAREVACLDFAAVTDHDFLLSTIHLGGYNYENMITNSFNQPGKFVTLIAYEWTRGFGYGHINVYYKNDDGPMYCFLDGKYDDVQKLIRALKDWKEQEPGRDVIAIPHHPTSNRNFFDWSYDWREIDPDIVPLVEINSVHGCAEMTKEDGNPYELSYLDYYALGEGYTVQSALSMGYKLGLIGSSDTHDARLGHPLLHVDNYAVNYPFATFEQFRAVLPYPGCLVGCWAKDLTREEIFNSLKSRRVCGSTHVSRPLITFSINGVSPGEHDSTVFVDNITSKRGINVSVAVDGNYPQNSIKSVILVKNNKDWVIFNASGLFYGNGTKIKDLSFNDRKYLKFSIIDSEPITGMEYNGGKYIKGKGYKITDDADKYFKTKPSTNGADVYYVRLIDNFDANGWGWNKIKWKGNYGWMGPIWVETQS
ncbi:MAG: DUF3604 domain-containing protein [Promethearchaeota archaeon]